MPLISNTISLNLNNVIYHIGSKLKAILFSSPAALAPECSRLPTYQHDWYYFKVASPDV